MTEEYYWLGAQGNIRVFSKSWNDRMSFIQLPHFEGKLGPCSINFYVNATTGNCSASWRVLASSLRVISAMIGNQPLLIIRHAKILKLECRGFFRITGTIQLQLELKPQI